MKKILSLLLALCLCASLVSCAAPAAETPAEPEATADTVTFTDDAGRAVELPAKIERVACAGTMAQIISFPVAADLLVGLSGKWGTDTEKYIDAKYLELPILGQFYGADDLNLESIAAADPQVIIDMGEPKDSIVEDMDGIAEQVGIPTVFIEASLETMPEAYRKLGKLLGLEAEAEEVAVYCETRYNEIKTKMDEMGDGKVSMLYLQGDAGLNVIAKGSYHGELIDLMSNNLAEVADPSSKGTGNEVSFEQILLWDPDVIIFAKGSIYGEVGGDPTWLSLKAIANGDYYEAPNCPYNWMGFPPSVNRYMGMTWLAELLYPEAFDYNLRQEVKDYYKMFYRCELTDAQYEELIVNAVPADAAA